LHRSLRLLLLTLGGLALPASAQELAQSAATTCRTMGPQAVMGICAITLIGTFTALITMRRRLGKEGWSLANALSEPTRLTIPIDPRWSQSQGDDQSEQGGGTAGISAVRVGSAKEGPPAALTILEASSSRLIAMVGMVVILLTYLGFGIFSLYTFGLTCQMPASTAAVTSFLYAGLTLFAPYAANKVSGILQPVLGSKPLPPPETAGTRLPPLAAASPAGPSPGDGDGDATAQRAAAPAATPVGPGVPEPAHRDGIGTASGTGAGVAAGPPRKPIGTPPTHRSFPVAHPPVEEPPTTKRTTTTPFSGAGDPYAAAVALIAEFEGFVDHAYPDPASGGEPWTIGYGFTSLQGRPVRPGDTISEAEAKQQLASGVEACGKHLGGTIPNWAAMAADQRCALISFAWNLGEDFYGSDGFNTISERLRDHAWADVPAALNLYCDPGSSVSAGLLRRRQAEGDLWRQGLSSASVARAGTASATATASSADRAAKPSSGAHPNPLNVRWFDQLAMNDGQGWRDCFSASSAMLATYWGKEPNEDDYNSLRQSYGDTTSAEAQLAALRHLGLQAEFRTDGTLQTLRDEINAGRPVAVGWLHHGPSSDPGGGGHWTVVIGYDDSGVIMNDPYGSCDLVNGGYPQNHNGARQHYSFKNWEPRWRPQGSGGWYLTCQL
jgi:GH24 family phage-related lysozyme (muramidase)